MLKAIIGTLLIAAGVAIYACLRVSGRESRREEKWEEKHIDNSKWCDLDCYRCEDSYCEAREGKKIVQSLYKRRITERRLYE